jgi:predicted anti-sigma-YlaC factor YlaD
MKNCAEIRKNFDERLDHRLAESQLRAFDSHISTCENCRRQWESYAAAWQFLARQETVEPSHGFAERTVRRLDEKPEAARPWFWQPAFRWMAVAVVAAICIGGFVARQRALDARRAEFYAQVQKQDYLDDYDVIAFLDQLELKKGENQL